MPLRPVAVDTVLIHATGLLIYKLNHLHLQFRLFSPQNFVSITGSITVPLITVVCSAITVRNGARNTITVQIARNGARYKDRNVAVWAHHGGGCSNDRLARMQGMGRVRDGEVCGKQELNGNR